MGDGGDGGREDGEESEEEGKGTGVGSGRRRRVGGVRARRGASAACRVVMTRVRSARFCCQQG